MQCRKNVRSLSLTEKSDFVRACEGVKGLPSVLHPGSQSRYDDYVEIHLNAMSVVPSWGHGGRAFLPWHRELLYRFEKDLQSIIPGVHIPYWDWTRHQTTAHSGFPFSNAFLGRNGGPGNPPNPVGDPRVVRDPAVTLNPDGTYPFEFDPDTWTVEVKDFAGDPDFLTRSFGTFGDAPDLPENDTVAVGSNASFRQAVGATTYGNLRQGSEDIHNLVHRWVNGAMLTASSPNDIIFWLHHAAIDRMWTIWQRKNPGLPAYVGSSTPGHGLLDTMIYYDPGETAPWSGTATPQQMIEGHTIHGDGVWYDTDLPEISLDSGPTLAFGTIPEGLTTYRGVRFRIQTCRPTRFRITGSPTGNFGLTTFGTEFIANPDDATDFVNGYVWVQFHAVEVTGVPLQSASVSIEAYVIDDDGYFAAAEGGEWSLGSWTINLMASVEDRENNAVVLVLDRSGSMAAAASGTTTRSSLLKNAVGVFHTLMLPNDELAVVSFDDIVETPLPLTTQSAGLGTLLTGSTLNPRGDTGIGPGILAAAPILAGSTHTNRSMLVLTDGNQNVHPYVEELPAGTITNRTFSIGFGLPGEVSDSVLNAIASNTGGTFTVTGNLTSDVQRFMLTKHFVQVLAGATNANIIVDPSGELGLGDTHTIEFDIAATDITIDAIALCPVAAFLEFFLRTPGGQIITPVSAATEPNVQFVVKDDVSFYRLHLPALPTDAAGSHAGKWVAGFRIRKISGRGQWQEEHRQSWEELSELRRRGTLPYSCVVHTYSNLSMHASLMQSDFAPGSVVKLEAALSEYGVPFGGRASVWADITRPDGSADSLTFLPAGVGRYIASYATTRSGIYQFRVRTTGATSAGDRFTREKLLTASTFAKPGGQDGNTGGGMIDGTRERDQRLCKLLLCLLEQDGRDGTIARKLRELGFDLNAIRSCIEEWCATSHTRAASEVASAAAIAELPPQAATLLSELVRRVASIDPEAIFVQTPAPIQLVRPAPQPKRRMPHSKGEHFPPVKMVDDDCDPATCGPYPHDHDGGGHEHGTDGDHDSGHDHGSGHDHPPGQEHDHGIAPANDQKPDEPKSRRADRKR